MTYGRPTGRLESCPACRDPGLDVDERGRLPKHGHALEFGLISKTRGTTPVRTVTRRLPGACRESERPSVQERDRRAATREADAAATLADSREDILVALDAFDRPSADPDVQRLLARVPEFERLSLLHVACGDHRAALRLVHEGRKASKHECGARCTSATGPQCDCRCRGANHGSGR